MKPFCLKDNWRHTPAGGTPNRNLDHWSCDSLTTKRSSRLRCWTLAVSRWPLSHPAAVAGVFQNHSVSFPLNWLGFVLSRGLALPINPPSGLASPIHRCWMQAEKLHCCPRYQQIHWGLVWASWWDFSLLSRALQDLLKLPSSKWTRWAWWTPQWWPRQRFGSASQSSHWQTGCASHCSSSRGRGSPPRGNSPPVPSRWTTGLASWRAMAVWC